MPYLVAVVTLFVLVGVCLRCWGAGLPATLWTTFLILILALVALSLSFSRRGSDVHWHRLGVQHPTGAGNLQQLLLKSYIGLQTHRITDKVVLEARVGHCVHDNADLQLVVQGLPRLLLVTPHHFLKRWQVRFYIRGEPRG